MTTNQDDQGSIAELMEAAMRDATSKRWDQAAQKLEELLVLDPNHLRALDLFGFVRFFQGRVQEAERFCRRALAISPNHAYAHKGLGLCLARQGSVDEGLQSLSRAMELRPDWGDPYWDTAVVLRDAGRIDEALHALQRGAEKVPKRKPEFDRFRTQLEKAKATDR